MRGEKTHPQQLKDIKVVGQYKRSCDAKFKEIYAGKNKHGIKVFFHIIWGSRIYLTESEFYKEWKSHKELKPLSEPATA